jgi:ligand-binding sensor domain-containing protein
MHFSNPVSFIPRWASLIALSSVTTVAFAGQDRIDFDRLSVEQGLSQSIIEQMVQGRKGFMWFATEDGLNRFDGYRFTVYKNVPGNPNMGWDIRERPQQI